MEALEERALLSVSPMNLDSTDYAPAMVAPSKASEILAPANDMIADLGETEQQTPDTPLALNSQEDYDPVEFEILQNFLELTNSSSVKNGTRLNSSYDVDNPETWTGVTWEEVDGINRVTQINWNNKSLVGELDLSGFTSLTTLNCYGNKLTTLVVSGCTALTTLTCSGGRGGERLPR